MEKLLLFGMGAFYRRRRELLKALLGEDVIVGFVDNRASEHRQFDDLPVYLPAEIGRVEYNRILLMSASLREMKEQLLALGVPSAKISFYEEYRAHKTRGTFPLPVPAETKDGKRRILIVAYDMGYDGGSMVAIYAAKALLARGHVVTLTAPSIPVKLANEVREMGVNFVLCPTLPYIGECERLWIKQYEILFVNVFQNSPVACSMRKEMPVIWWIHEPSEAYSDIYPRIRYQFAAFDSPAQMDGLHIFGVSPLAANVFSKQYPGVPIGVLPYGIPDVWDRRQEFHDVPVFAIIGGIMSLKGQRELIRAFQLLQEQLDGWEAELWLIGAQGLGGYGREVMDLVQRTPHVKYRGVLTRNEMEEAYQYIDVVVCASQEETMSAVCVEGLMHAKICVTTKNTGIASYLEDGVSGFVCEDNQPGHLFDTMRRVQNEREKWDVVGRRGRALYEEYFSMKKFGEHLERSWMI